MEVIVQLSYEAGREEYDDNYIGREWLDALEAMFGNNSRRIDYGTLIIAIPAPDPLLNMSLEALHDKLDSLIYNGTNRYIELVRVRYLS